MLFLLLHSVSFFSFEFELVESLRAGVLCSQLYRVTIHNWDAFGGFFTHKKPLICFFSSRLRGHINFRLFQVCAGRDCEMLQFASWRC